MQTQESVMPRPENTNGTFLANIEPQGLLSSSLAGAVEDVQDLFIERGGLKYVLDYIKDNKGPVLSDYQKNGALDALADNPEVDGFDDTTSNRQQRTQEAYLVKASVGPSNPLNEDRRFPGFRPKGFEIGETQQAAMAIVALDPSLLDPRIDESHRAELLDEVKMLREAVMKNGEVDKELSPHLTEILSSCLLTDKAIVNSHAEDGSVEQWPLPFDKIASIKALYTLLSGEENSGAMRQGAVRMTNENGQEIIVGCSGLNSAIDEMVARNFADAVLEQASSSPAR